MRDDFGRTSVQIGPQGLDIRRWSRCRGCRLCDRLATQRRFDLFFQAKRADVVLVECQRLLASVERRLELPLRKQLPRFLQRRFQLHRAAPGNRLTIGSLRIGRWRELGDGDGIILAPARRPGSSRSGGRRRVASHRDRIDVPTLTRRVATHARDGGTQAFGVREAIGGLLLERLLNDRDQLGWRVRGQTAEWHRILVENPVSDHRKRVAGKCLGAGQELVKHHADRELVGAVIDRIAGNLFGRHVSRRADHH